MTRIVKYTEEQFKKAMQIAANRNDPKERAGVKSKLFAPLKKTNKQIHEEGMRGELGVSIWSGQPIREDYSLAGEKPNGKWDFILPVVGSTEVKFRTKRYYEFALPDDKLSSFVTNIGILVIPGVEPNTVELKGWIDRESFVKKCVRDNFKYGWRLKIRNEDLFPIQELEKIIGLRIT